MPRKSATSRHAQRAGQRNRTSGRGSGRTTKSSRARKTTREIWQGEYEEKVMKVRRNPRTGRASYTDITGKKYL